MAPSGPPPAPAGLPGPEGGRDARVPALAGALMRFTPELTLAEESVILMEVTASLRLFGGIRALRSRVRRVLARAGGGGPGSGPPPVLAVAASGPAAWMLARSGRGGSALGARSLARALARVPLDVAPPARPFAGWFQELGCATLADLRRLPRIGLKKRCGPALLDWLDRLGNAHAPVPPPVPASHGPGPQPPARYRWLTPPPAFDAALEMPDHIEHAPALAWAVQHLVRQLCAWLAAHRLDAEALTVLLGHDRIRPGGAAAGAAPGVPGPMPAGRTTTLDIGLGAPSRDPESLARLVRERLNRLVLPASVIMVRLRVTQLRAARTPSLELFPEPGGAPQDHARLLELLAARLGAENVLAPAPVADHRPEQAARWVPLDLGMTGRHAPGGQAGGHPALPRPAWLLDAPVPLPVRGHRPFHGTPLRLVSPAERLDCGWQDGCPVARDYFVAEDEAGTCYWIFRTGTGTGAGTGQGPDAAPTPQWYLHGLFA